MFQKIIRGRAQTCFNWNEHRPLKTAIKSIASNTCYLTKDLMKWIFPRVNLQQTSTSNRRTTFQHKHKNTLTTNSHLTANRSSTALAALQLEVKSSNLTAFTDWRTIHPGVKGRGVQHAYIRGSLVRGVGGCNHIWRWGCWVGRCALSSCGPQGPTDSHVQINHHLCWVNCVWVSLRV